MKNRRARNAKKESRQEEDKEGCEEEEKEEIKLRFNQIPLSSSLVFFLTGGERKNLFPCFTIQIL